MRRSMVTIQVAFSVLVLALVCATAGAQTQITITGSAQTATFTSPAGGPITANLGSCLGTTCTLSGFAIFEDSGVLFFPGGSFTYVTSGGTPTLTSTDGGTTFSLNPNGATIAFSFSDTANSLSGTITITSVADDTAAPRFSGGLQIASSSGTADFIKAFPAGKLVATDFTIGLVGGITFHTIFNSGGSTSGPVSAGSVQTTSPVLSCVDAYDVNYYSNAHTTGAEDATVRVINPGTTSASPTEAADLCALIYVFDANQELSECCGCVVTANELRTLSVNNDLTSNPLLGTLLHTGVIKIVASAIATPCDPTKLTPTPSLRSWATHIQNKVNNTAFPETEGESQQACLGIGEQADLGEDCSVLRELGSGKGVCSCPPGH